MKKKYMLASLVNKREILNLINTAQSLITQKTSDKNFIPKMSPHITFVPPFFATYEDVKRLCNTFNFLLSRAEGVIFTSSDLDWMNFGEDILHIPIRTYPGFIINIEQLRVYVGENFDYVNKTPNRVFYPHITVAKGVELKNLTGESLDCLSQEKITSTFGSLEIFEKLPKGWAI